MSHCERRESLRKMSEMRPRGWDLETFYYIDSPAFVIFFIIVAVGVIFKISEISLYIKRNLS